MEKLSKAEVNEIIKSIDKTNLVGLLTDFFLKLGDFITQKNVLTEDEKKEMLESIKPFYFFCEKYTREKTKEILDLSSFMGKHLNKGSP